MFVLFVNIYFVSFRILTASSVEAIFMIFADKTEIKKVKSSVKVFKIIEYYIFFGKYIQT